MMSDHPSASSTHASSHSSSQSSQATSSRPLEILAFGEAMALLVAESEGDLAQVSHYERRIAGADTNVAIGLARLGFHVGWLSRVGHDSLGRYLRHTLEAEGLDCRHLSEDALAPTGLMFKARAKQGEDPHVEYFRQGSAASRMDASDASGVDFSALRHLHATGIPPAVSTTCRELSFALFNKARASGASISFDPNLRPTLWSSEHEMRETLNQLACQADWVFPGLSEGQFLTGKKTPEAVAGYYLERGAKAVIIKLGPEGSYYRGVIGGQEAAFSVPGQRVDKVIDTVGAGDAFAVGAVSALLDGLSPRDAMLRANLLGSRAVQVRGDMEGLPDRATLDELERKLTSVDGVAS